MVSREEIAPILSKVSRRIGLEVNDIIILNAYIMHEGFYQERVIKNQILEMTARQGYIFMVRLYPSGNIKFTYSTSLSKEEKEKRINEEFNGMDDILHVFETDDTIKFYHQFLKKLFSNRLADGYTLYQLTDEDIEYLKKEKFPSNAMEWLFGNVAYGKNDH
jgi:hypothetical protein